MYVANRVTEILERSSVARWCHVPIEKNPADICSRGVASPVDLLKIKGINKNHGIKDKYFFGIT